ncbi:MAG: hypothetical protein CVU96_06445 [Firmicutes bacterium HGW-Firmicutes-20]|jgi:hypothetical protein|nr:MAG: hypothetical protein CVU96_06445 [Firmicutes bacterium HGW-Firmicutes-20]PKM67796.1 MAG: hypothetical protein CVU94_05995 [Firmicutes bacterium HGW-Firmicutes-19]
MDEFDLVRIAEKLNSRITHEYHNNTFFKISYDISRAFSGSIFKVLEDVLEEENIIKYEKSHYNKGIKYYQSEKMTVDRVVWLTSYDKVKKGVENYVWKYEILIEHENDGTDWLHEMQKLCSMNAPYKLIITYGRTKNASDGMIATPPNKGVNLLGIAKEIIEYTNDQSCKQLVIMFGEESINLSTNGSKNLYDIYYWDFDKEMKDFDLL